MHSIQGSQTILRKYNEEMVMNVAKSETWRKAQVTKEWTVVFAVKI